MPIVVSYDDPTLVASLAANSADYIEQAPSRNVITRVSGDVNRRPLSDVSPGYSGAQQQAIGTAPGGMGTIPTPMVGDDGRVTGYTGGARIYYPEGATVPAREAAMTQQMIQEGAQVRRETRDNEQRSARDAEQFRRQSALNVQQARLRDILGQQDDARTQEVYKQNRERTEADIIDAVQRGYLTPDEAAKLKLNIGADGLVSRGTSGLGMSPNQQRVASQQAYTNELNRQKITLDQVESDVKDAEDRLKDARKSLDKIPLTDGKPDKEDEAKYAEAIKQRDDALRALGSQMKDDGGLYSQRKKARNAVRNAASASTDPKFGAAPTRVTTEQEVNALPKGALFIGPDGVIRRK